MNPRISFLCVLPLFLGLVAVRSRDSSPQKPAEYPSPAIREEQQVVVDGVAETWRLQWKKVPQPYCAASEPEALTCPCSGFAYGEAGDLDLSA